jgi:HTH-type transcriptional regulator, sugar sensing transcriptional regulator
MSLKPFGFTRTQDAVFWALVRSGSATGYAVARDTGIARANVYHALDGLAKRGLVSATAGRPVHYRAADANACLALLSVGVSRQLSDLALRWGVEAPAIGQTPSPESAGRGELSSRREAVAAASRCIATARLQVLAVVGPWVPELARDLDDARRRGVAVRAVSLGSPAPEGVIVREVPRTELEAYWGGLPISVVVDRRRAVCAVLAADWTRGIVTSNAGAVPFLRHLLRRELAAAASPRVS